MKILNTVLAIFLTVTVLIVAQVPKPGGGQSAISTGSTVTLTPNVATGASYAALPLSGWTLKNAANAHGSYDDFSSDELVMTAGNFGTLEWSAITRPLSVPYTLYARVEIRNWQQVAAIVGGVCISDGTKYETLEVAVPTTAANIGLEVRTLTNLNAAGTETIITGPTTNIVGSTFSVKISNDSSTRTFSYWGGSAWVSFKSEAAATFLTETAAGTCLLDKVNTGGFAPEVALKYWSVN